MSLDLTTVYVAVGAVLLGAAAGAILMYAARRKPLPANGQQPARRGEDTLTFVAAALATGVAATGMWQFFRDVLHLPTVFLVGMFAFLEVAMFASALRARRNVLEFGSAGADGTAVWALTGLSALLSATDSHSTKEAAFRLAAPLVAAWLWERGMAIERRRQQTSVIHWRISRERILVRLGLAEASDRTAADVDAHRRITRLARAAKRLRTLQATDAWKWRIRLAIRRVDRAMERAAEHAGLASDPHRRQQLMEQIRALYNAASLADLTPPAPWTTGLPHQPSTTETAFRELADVGTLVLDNRTRRALGLKPTTPAPRPVAPADDAPTPRPTTAPPAPAALPTAVGVEDRRASTDDGDVRGDGDVGGLLAVRAEAEPSSADAHLTAGVLDGDAQGLHGERAQWGEQQQEECNRSQHGLGV